MKTLICLTIVICACTFPSLAQTEDSLKEYSNYFIYSDPHDTDMDERIKQMDAHRKYKDLIGKSITYDFGDFGFEVIFKSDTLIYWKSLKTDYEETDICKTIHLDPYSVMTAWEELNGSYVNLYSNFDKRKASFFIRSKDGNHEGYSGKIKIK